MKSKSIFKISVFSFFCLLAQKSFSYPEFIGYGYTSCITCHFNGQGHGDLNDYGRALWSAEIASRSVFPKTWSDDDIAALSGALVKKELPWWLRPSLKTRTLINNVNPGSAAATSKFYVMQVDLNGTFLFDQDANHLLHLSTGIVPQSESTRRGQSSNFIIKDYYYRVQPIESWWIYIGLMDKVFGLRNLDHTAYQRSSVGLTQFAQSHGAVVHKINEKWELTGNAFFGNAHITDQTQEHKGLTLMGEYEPIEKLRFGSSVLSSKSEVEEKTALSAHYRQGLTKGNSIMAEIGYVNNKPKASSQTIGNYIFLESTYLITRGYHFQTAIEKYTRNTLSTVPDNWRYSFGLLAFPMPRFEFRVDISNLRTVGEADAEPDQWLLQGQVHVSL